MFMNRVFYNESTGATYYIKTYEDSQHITIRRRVGNEDATRTFTVEHDMEWAWKKTRGYKILSKYNADALAEEWAKYIDDNFAVCLVYGFLEGIMR